MGRVDVTEGELLERARSSLDCAYAPYSNFAVGAAVVDDRGRVFTGVNVENASYGLTICAERVAIFTAIASGARRILAIAVAAKHLAPVTPCGACRQVISEFCDPSAKVLSDDGHNSVVVWTVGELLPDAFMPNVVRRRRAAPKSPRSA